MWYTILGDELDLGNSSADSTLRRVMMFRIIRAFYTWNLLSDVSGVSAA